MLCLTGLLATWITLALTGHDRSALASQTRTATRAVGRVVAAPTAPPAFYSTAFAEARPAPALGVTAKAGILVDLDARRVLWERSSREQRAPASLTKMVTAMVALDHAALDSKVVVPDAAVHVEPDVMGLSAGEVVSVRELLYGLFLDSGNDAAETLARTLMPRDRFLALMNAKAAGWGLGDTHFVNPSGLDSAGHRSTAYDLAVIAGHLELEHPELMQIAGTREHPIPGTSEHKAFDPHNLNKLLWQYPGATGLKTGLTDDAGGCVAASATRGGRHLVAIVLDSDVFFTDAIRLLDYGFSIPA